MRIGLLKRITIALFLFLIASLAYNQVIRGPYYFQLSQNNRIKLIKMDAPRGFIYDRQGRVVAGLRLVFNVAVLPQEVEDIKKTIAAISPLAGVSESALMQYYKNNFFAPFLPVVILHDVPKEKAILLECQEFRIPGLLIQTQPLRNYPYGKSISHLLGYLGKITKEELRQLKEYGVWDRDILGRTGVEGQLDPFLRGQTGGRQIEVNNRGRQVRELGVKQPLPGEDLYLTIDAELQALIGRLMEGHSGACVVLDPRNGEILAMVSEPSFDPQIFVMALNNKTEAARTVSRYLSSGEGVLVNRAISGAYPAGSIFKIVVAVAGLETNAITPNSTTQCTGSIRVGNRSFNCWKLDGHGTENIYTALAHSCNVFFYRLGLALGPDKIALFARSFGLGERSGIDLSAEAAGNVPSKIWKLKTKKEKWYDGETANLAIGQGYLLVTPLQMARLIAAIANGGYRVRPHLVKKFEDKETAVVREKLALKPSTLEVIREGMRMVVQNDDGTGHRAYISGVQWAAKTGTAQAGTGTAHGWFGGFYPFHDPRLAIVVFLEHGGSGGDVPALIAREIVEYFRTNKVN
ncbi:MAG: penicillin-binding protein 2 [Candidatus Omnitrophota bacterium]